MIVLKEAHLRAVLHEFVRYYNQERPHRTLALETPTLAVRGSAGRIVSRPVLGGLHHTYQRVA
jgi:transposase InsO family protein